MPAEERQNPWLQPPGGGCHNRQVELRWSRRQPTRGTGRDTLMAGSFDPYREWLAITSGGQPHNYYDLLGLRPLESDIGKINAAFRRQSDRLAPHLSGAQAAMAQRLMTELTEARMTLLTPTAKRAYDQSLAGGQPTTGPAAPADSKPARWSGSPTPESGDALLPPSALPGGTAGATPRPAT